MPSFIDRARASWNILLNRDALTIPHDDYITSVSPSSSYSRVSYDNAKGVLAPILTRIAIDAASVPLRHVLQDSNEQLIEIRRSELDDRLNIQANIDQSGTAFIQDSVMTMLELGAVALVPVDVSSNPNTGTFDILTLRAAEVTQWNNRSVEVRVYNENTGDSEQIILPKSYVAIAYNPLYAVMNASNSTLRRLIDKLALLDVADNRLYSRNLDLILQLSYSLRAERRQEEADRRLTAIEEQLLTGKYGMAYIDSTEKITQLNRPVTNSLFETVVSLTESLHSQLGITPAIFAGAASQEELVLYNNRTILPILKALTDSMRMTFFTRTAITQGHSVKAIHNMFKMAPIEQMADAADKFTRNEIMTSNEVRSFVGMIPSKEAGADELRNKNLNKSDGELPKETGTPPGKQEAPIENQGDKE